MSAVETQRTKLIAELKLMLGDQMIDIDLDPEHYNTAIDLAIDRFRQRGSAANEESTLFLTLQPGRTEYILPKEVQMVRKLYRRGVGVNTAGGTNFDPFEAAFSNIYLLQAGRTGGLATWEFFSQYQETIGRVFGAEINFTWESSTHKLTLIRRITAEEDVAVHVFNAKPEMVLLDDVYVRPWLRDYSLAQCKLMLGAAYSRFASGLPGPTGAVTYNGDSLKQEGNDDLARLEEEILNFATSGAGWPFIIA